MYSERKMAEGFVTPRSPWSVIAKTPNSFTAPKAVLEGAHEAEVRVGVPFEVEHRVDDVLQDAGTRQGPDPS